MQLFEKPLCIIIMKDGDTIKPRVVVYAATDIIVLGVTEFWVTKGQYKDHRDLLTEFPKFMKKLAAEYNDFT